MKLILDISFIKHLKVKIFPEPAECWADFCWHSADQGISNEQGQSLLQKRGRRMNQKSSHGQGNSALLCGPEEAIKHDTCLWDMWCASHVYIKEDTDMVENFKEDTDMMEHFNMKSHTIGEQL